MYHTGIEASVCWDLPSHGHLFMAESAMNMEVRFSATYPESTHDTLTESPFCPHLTGYMTKLLITLLAVLALHSDFEQLHCMPYQHNT
jgi:hypothetical protein